MVFASSTLSLYESTKDFKYYLKTLMKLAILPSIISLTFKSKLRKLATFVSKVSSARFLLTAAEVFGSLVWNQEETSLIENSALSATYDLFSS